MRRALSTPLLVALTTAAALAVATAPAGAANLLQNPGAEGDPDGQTVSGWTPGPGGFQAKAYGGTFPSTVVSAANGGGTNFFWAGNTAASSVSQTYTPTPADIALIDAGRAQVTLAADIGGWSTQNDAAEVTAAFRDDGGPASSDLGSSLLIGPVLAGDRNSQTTLVRRSATGAVPVGTRRIRVLVVATRKGGQSNDGYVDNVLLELGELTPEPAAAPGPDAGAPTSPAAPAPVLGKAVGAGAVAGVIRVKLPGSSRYVPLDGSKPLPVGSVIDSRRGRVALTSALPRGREQTASFWGGIFRVRQSRKASGTVRLVVPRATGCRTAAAHTTRSEDARRAKRTKRRRPSLWGRDRNGRYQTQGSSSVATVRGTLWQTLNRCDGTLTRVRKGVVVVRDLRLRRNVRVTAGHSYLARRR